MSWTFTSDPELYAERALPLLLSRPVANTLPLTVLESVRSGQQFGDRAPLFGWFSEAGEVTGAVSMTPPYGLLLATLPESSAAELVARLRQDQVEVPDVAGELGAVHHFIERWTAGTELRTELIMRQRLYRLDVLQPPPKPPAGSARAVGAADLELVVAWMTAFRDEAEPRVVGPSPSVYQRRVELGLLWFWCDPAGRPVAFAGRNVQVAGASRIGPVYTPPEFRRHGYGAAATHACTQDALDQGAESVLLFTDEANRTSNSIYQSLGYRHLDDRLILRFV